MYGVPILGTLIRAARLAAFAELLGVLVEYELPLPEAFRLAGAATSDPLMAARAREVHDALTRGESVGDALRGRGLVPAWVAWMAAAGAARGELGAALRQVAGIYRRLAKSRATVLRTVLPPVPILTTAAVLVAVFVFAVMTPVIKLLEGLSS